MRVLATLSVLLPLLACESSTGTSKRSTSMYSSTQSRNASPATAPAQDPKAEANPIEAGEGRTPWIGIVPEKSFITTQRTVHSITMIDSDLSMASELPFGFLNLTQAAAKVDKTPTQTGFDVMTGDHAFVVVDNSMQIFANGERTTIINKVLTNATFKSELIQILDEQFLKDPDYAKKNVPSITILSDGDIPEADQIELTAYLKQRFPDGGVYLHLITSPDVVPTSDWCFPEALPQQWQTVQTASPKGLRLSICDPDWYGHFRKIGKRVIYDQGVTRILLPEADVVAGAKPYLRFNQQAFPTDLYKYDPVTRQIELKLVDMPTHIQTIDIGFPR